MFRLYDILEKNTQSCEECENISEVISHRVNDTTFVTFFCSRFQKGSAAMYIFLYKPGLLVVLFYNLHS